MDFEYVQAGSRKELSEMLADGTVDMAVDDGCGRLGGNVTLLPRPVGPVVKMLCVREGDDRFCSDDLRPLDGMAVAMLDCPELLAEFERFEADREFLTEKHPYDSGYAVRTALLVGDADVALLDNFEETGGLVILTSFCLSDRHILIRDGCPELLAAVSRGEEALFRDHPFFLSELYERHFAQYASRSFAFSKEEQALLKGGSSVNVYLRDDIPMVSWLHDGEFTGFFPMLLSRMSQRSGIRFNLIACGDSDVMVSAVKSDPTGCAFCIIPQSRHFLQDKELVFVQHGTVIPVLLLVKKGRLKNIVSVAIPEHGYSFRDHVFRNGFYSKEYKDEAACIDAVLSGEVDATMMESYRAQAFMNKRKFRNQLSVSLEPVLETTISFVAPAAADRSLISILDKLCLSYSGNDPWSDGRENMMQDYGGDSLFDLIFEYWYFICILLLVFLATLIIIFLQHRFTRQLEASNRNKDVFLADLSHDFRTPLTAISGFAYLGKSENDPRYYPEIITSAAYMQELVNDILNIRQYSEGKSLELQPEPIIAETLYDSILSVVHGRAAAKRIRIDFESDISYPYVVLDPMRIKQVFVNIIGNAIKYSSQESVVEVRVEDYVKSHLVWVKATITDHGEGMSRDFIRQRIFRPFEREKNAYSAKEGGSGLGLAITKIIMDRLGGTIAVESELGKGSSFTLDFPEETITKEEYERKHPEDSPSRKKELDFTGFHVLLCEDNEINTFIISNILQKRGFVVDCAENGQVGLEHFQNSSIGYYQLILMDIRMPKMDGIEATKAIRALNRSDAQMVPIIALSANAFEEDKMLSARAGMNAPLSKPIDVDALFRTIEQLSPFC